MMNKMLLVNKVVVDGIPVDPYETESTTYVPTNSTLEAQQIFGFNPTLTMPFDVSISMPKNHCTLLFGVSDELFEVIRGKCEPFNSRITVSIRGSTYDYVDVLDLETVVGGEDWTSTKNEVHVQLDFEDTSNMVIHPRIEVTGLIHKDTEVVGTTDNPITAYGLAYLVMTNEVHAHGPDEGWTITL